MDSEEKYLDIREKLKNLEQIKAGDDFVYKLQNKIVELEAENRKDHSKIFNKDRGGFLRNLFANRQYPWLIPAVGFTMLIFFVFYITFLNKNASVNNTDTLSIQKSEQTETKNSPPPQNTASEKKDSKSPVTPEPDNSNSGNETLTQRDLAGDLKKGDKSISGNENGKQLNEKDEVKNNLNSPKTFAQNRIEKKVDTENDNKDLSKQNSEPATIENNGMVGVEPLSKDSNNKRSETDDKTGSVTAKDESNNIKLIEKLNIIDKANLENLRDKVSNK